MTDARVTQLSAEVWATPEPPFVDCTQLSAEAWIAIFPEKGLWASQLSAEVWASFPRNRFWATQISGELWISSRPLGMTYPIYPVMAGVGYSVYWRPEFSNVSDTASNKTDVDLSVDGGIPIHHFELVYDFLRNTTSPDEFRQYGGFFMSVRANAGRFLFLWDDDNSAVGESLGTTDGVSNDYGPIQRTFGVAPNVEIEPVGYVNLDFTPVVYLDGVAQAPGTFTIDRTYPVYQKVHFLIPPAAGKAITIDFHFYYYCKFEEDNINFEKFMSTLWTIKSVKIKSLRFKS